MERAATIGIGLAGTVFELNALDAEGAALVRRKLRRARALTFPEGPPPRLAGTAGPCGSASLARIIGRAARVLHLRRRIHGRDRPKASAARRPGPAGAGHPGGRASPRTGRPRKDDGRAGCRTRRGEDRDDRRGLSEGPPNSTPACASK